MIAPDELTLFFSSNRVGGTGGFDMYEARRASVADGFSAPIELARLNTDGFDTPNWVSEDGCELYFTRGELNLGNQLYVATRGR